LRLADLAELIRPTLSQDSGTRFRGGTANDLLHPIRQGFIVAGIILF